MHEKAVEPQFIPNKSIYDYDLIRLVRHSFTRVFGRGSEPPFTLEREVSAKSESSQVQSGDNTYVVCPPLI